MSQLSRFLAFVYFAAAVSVTASIGFLEDSADLERDGSILVSYAPALERITAAVVSVDTEEIVEVRRGRQRELDSPSRSQIEEFLRRFYGLPEQAPSQPQEPEPRSTAPQRELRPSGSGSGVIVSADGYIVTNHHVITGRSGRPVDAVEVTLVDGRKLVASIVGSDIRTDVALLKVESDEPLPVATINRNEDLKVGDIVFAIGNPLNVGLTATQGIISATGRSNLGILDRGGYENFIQTDASINLGNSGGALVDAHGRLIGINTAILSRSGGNIGIGFAIPVSLVVRVAEDLKSSGQVSRGFLGVRPDDLDPTLAEAFGLKGGEGALVTEVTSDSPASRAGLKRGDIILTVGGIGVRSGADLRLKISFYPPGSTAQFKVFRDGEMFEVDIELGDLDVALRRGINGPRGLQRPPEPEATRKPIIEGLEMKMADAAVMEGIAGFSSGIELVVVNPISAYASQLSPGNIVLEWNGKQVESLESLGEIIQSGINRLYVWNGETFRYVAIRLP